jgi:hypothetical protein
METKGYLNLQIFDVTRSQWRSMARVIYSDRASRDLNNRACELKSKGHNARVVQE